MAGCHVPADVVVAVGACGSPVMRGPRRRCGRASWCPGAAARRAWHVRSARPAGRLQQLQLRQPRKRFMPTITVPMPAPGLLCDAPRGALAAQLLELALLLGVNASGQRRGRELRSAVPAAPGLAGEPLEAGSLADPAAWLAAATLQPSSSTLLTSRLDQWPSISHAPTCGCSSVLLTGCVEVLTTPASQIRDG